MFRTFFVLSVSVGCFALTGVSQGNDGQKLPLESDSIEYLYQQYYENIETKRESDGKLDSILIFDSIRSGYNIIDIFGPNFFSNSNPELIDTLEQYLSVDLEDKKMTFIGTKTFL